MNKRSREELQDAGWAEEIEVAVATSKSQPKAEKSPYVVVDNSEQLKQMNRSNELLREALNEMVTKLAEVNQRPKALDLDIQRTSAGFMDNVRITLEY